VTAENVSALRSGGVLVATFIGGTPFFFGPVIGAMVYVFFIGALSGFTQAWLLYLGLFFVAMVLYAPGGIASLIALQFPVIRAGRFRGLLLPYLAAAGAALIAVLGLIGVVEMIYRLSDTSLSPQMRLFGLAIHARSAPPWIGFGLTLAAGLALLRGAARWVAARWGSIQRNLGRAASGQRA